MTRIDAAIASVTRREVNGVRAAGFRREVLDAVRLATLRKTTELFMHVYRVRP